MSDGYTNNVKSIMNKEIQRVVPNMQWFGWIKDLKILLSLVVC